jgi:predicted transcriptional regulator
MGELVIRIDPETAERLNRLSASGQRSPEEIALDAIRELVDDLEEAPEALRRLGEIDEGRVTPIPHEQTMRDLGLED